MNDPRPKLLIVTTDQLAEGYIERIDETLYKRTYTVVENRGDRHLVMAPTGEVVK